MRGRHSHEFLVACAAAFVLVAHLLLARPALEDIDSLNFALGIGDYDVARHQPHPPGYPVFILAARVVTTVLRAALPSLESPEAAGLVLLAALAGAVAIVMSRRVLAASGCTPWTATGGALLFACAPLPWISGLRPLSDMPGFAVALVSQWLLLRVATPDAAVSWRRLAFAGLWTGLAVGVRSQVLWLTLPLAAVVAFRHLRAGRTRGAAVLAAALAVGALLWLTPMLWLSGGADDYLQALEDQADDDFEGVPMLATQFGVARLQTALLDTFVQPWAVWPVAVVALGGAVIGAGRLAVRRSRVLSWFALLWGPYVAYHLLFQETETTRYALPAVLPLCALVAAALDVTARAPMQRLTAALAATTLLAMVSVSLRTSWQYAMAREGVFDALQAMRQEAQRHPPDVVLMHHRVWAETRRARDMVTVPGVDSAPVPRAYEWMRVLPWVDRQALRAWWLVDPTRGDRVAIDPRSFTLRERFEWPPPLSALLGGLRPHPFAWFVLTEPSWVLHQGWALTPALAGLSHAAGAGPGAADGARATVRRAAEARTLLIGGRHLGQSSAPVALEVAVGDAWRVRSDVQPGVFHRVWTLPASASPETVSQVLTVRASGGDPAEIALEQFDAQPKGVPVLALADGWFEPERDVITGRTWRWMSDRARVEVWGAPCDVRLTLTGTWPRHYGDPPVLTVRTATGTELTRTPVTRPFAVTVVVPAPDAGMERVDLDLGVSRAFVAGAHTGSADARRLSLEIGELSVHPVNGDRSCPVDVDSITHESVRFPRLATRGR